jgi:PAS domain S-box-containing protein
MRRKSMSMAHSVAFALTRKPSFKGLLIGLIVAVAVVAAIVAWRVEQGNQEQKAQRFAEVADQVTDNIHDRLLAYEYGLRGTRGAIIAVGGNISRERFKAYSASRDYTREFPGVNGFGFIQRVPADQIDAFLEDTHRDGMPGFTIRQLEPHEGERFIIRYTEPEQSNQNINGFDIASESHRREAAILAARTGNVVLTAPLTPAQDRTAVRRGFLLLLPVYREGMPLNTPDERWAATYGWAFAPLRIERVLEGLADTRQLYGVSLSDLSEGQQPVNFFSSRDYVVDPNRLSVERTIPAYDRSWAMSLQARPEMMAQFKQVPPWVAAVLVLAIGWLSVALLYLWLLGRERRRAVGIYQARVAALVDSSSDAIIACDTHGVVTHWNPAAETMLGRSSEEAVGHPLPTLLAGKVDALGQGGDLQPLAGASLKLPQRDGAPDIDATASVAPIRDPKGDAVGTSVILHDISERVRAEERFRLVVEATPSAILMVDTEGRISLANAKAEELFGYTRQELLGNSVNMLLDTGTRSRHDSYIKAYFSNPIARPMGAGRDLYGRRRDSVLVPVEIGLSPIETSNGRYVLASIIDITERKRNEARILELNSTLEQQVQERTEQLRTYSARLQAILEHAGYAIVATDTNGVITLFNPEAERMLGYHAGEMIGLRNIACLHSTDELDSRAALLSASLGEPVSSEFIEIAARSTLLQRDIGEWTYLRKDGTSLPVTLGISTLRDEHGVVSGYLVLATDLSEQKHKDALLHQAMNEAEQANRYKSDFLANMSHEIRTPMNAILGMVYLLEKVDLTETARDMVHKINTSARSLLSIINDVLDFSKIEAGRIELENEPFDLSEVLENIASLMATAVGNKSVEMIVSPAPPAARFLRGDALRLSQVLINLVGNAIKFTERGEVSLSVKQIIGDEPDKVRLAFAVSDTGIGIPTEKQRHIFSPFGQVDSSTTRKYGGTGLGLSICSRLVQLMGGQLQVDSKPGQGSHFYFDIPLTLGEPVETFPDKNRAYNVLVVDDHITARANLSLIIEGFGWQPVTVASGEEAIRAATERDGGYDIVLMDWRMPGMDGLQAAAAIRREVSAGQHQPVVIMVTAYEREQIERDARSEVVDAVLTKPATASTLFNSIMDALSRRGRISAPPKRVKAVARRLAGFQLLVVDDSEINREVAQRILESEGAEVELAGDGKEALDAIARDPSRFDVILMDVQMPEMDGYEATRQIRSTPVMSALPIIALTAGAFKRQQEAALSAGMNAFVAKPFEVDELVSVICQMAPERVRTWHKPSSTTVSAEPTVAEIDPQVLNVEKGLTYWNDDTKYRRYLGQFSREYAQAGETVAEMLRQGNNDKASAYLHKMRGAAGSLMLPGIAAISTEIEMALEDGKDASSFVDMFKHRLDEGLAHIRKYLGVTESKADAAPEAMAQAKPRAPAEATQRLSETLQALDTDDPNQVERALEKLAALVPAEWFAELVRRVQEFDFRAAEAWILSYCDDGSSAQ